MTGGATRIFHYDLWGHIIAETNQSGQMLAEYVYLGDQLLAMIRPGESVYYFHNDHLGTPQVLTDGTGSIAWKATYTPFGEAVPSIETVENPFRFPGQYYDAETGLHYNYFRYYDPTTGRYVTPDPIGLEGGINLWAYVDSVGKPFETNLYTYTGNNPVNWMDPWGLAFITSEDLQKILLNAATWELTPYLKNGKTRKGADCSGSTWGIYREVGFPYAYRESSSFPGPEFKKVIGDLQPGDVVRWSGHLAIFAGEGKVWSARREGFNYGLYPMEWFTKKYGPPTYYRYWK